MRNFTRLAGRKNKPNQTQFKANPRKGQNERKKCYNNELQRFSPLTGVQKQTQTKPIQTQLEQSASPERSRRIIKPNQS